MSLSALSVGATDITNTSVTLVGAVNTRGANASVWFNWGQHGSGVFQQTPSAAVQTTTGSAGVYAPTVVQADLSGLTFGEEYDFYITAQAGSALVNSAIQSWSSVPPVVLPVATTQDGITPHFAFPLTMTDQGIAVVDENSDAEIMSCVLAVANCQQGAWDFSPQFGIPDYTFSDVPLNTGSLQTALAMWEPRVSTDIVQTIVDAGGGQVQLTVTATPTTGASSS